MHRHRRSRLVGILLMVGIPFWAHAEQAPGHALGQVLTASRTPVEVIEFDRQLSRSGSSRDDFVIQVAQTLRSFTDRTGYESGGLICQDDQGRWGMILQSAQAQVFMPITAACPEGFGRTDQSVSVHTHPQRPFIVTNSADAAFLGPRHRPGESLKAEGAFFSVEDFQDPGYVITPLRILFQAGPQNVRSVLP